MAPRAREGGGLGWVWRLRPSMWVGADHTETPCHPAHHPSPPAPANLTHAPLAAPPPSATPSWAWASLRGATPSTSTRYRGRLVQGLGALRNVLQQGFERGGWREVVPLAGHPPASPPAGPPAQQTAWPPPISLLTNPQALQRHEKFLERERAAAAAGGQLGSSGSAGAGGAQRSAGAAAASKEVASLYAHSGDLALKDGQTIHVNIKAGSAHGSASGSAHGGSAAAAGGTGGSTGSNSGGSSHGGGGFFARAAAAGAPMIAAVPAAGGSGFKLAPPPQDLLSGVSGGDAWLGEGVFMIPGSGRAVVATTHGMLEVSSAISCFLWPVCRAPPFPHPHRRASQHSRRSRRLHTKHRCHSRHLVLPLILFQTSQPQQPLWPYPSGQGKLCHLLRQHSSSHHKLLRVGPRLTREEVQAVFLCPCKGARHVGLRASCMLTSACTWPPLPSRQRLSTAWPPVHHIAASASAT